jgi:hypothetical protein
VTPSSAYIDYVVVPVDGTPFADRALRPAQSLPDRLHASLNVVTVTSASGHPSSRSLGSAAEVLIGDDAGQAIGEYAEQLTGSLVCMFNSWPKIAGIGLRRIGRGHRAEPHRRADRPD